MTGRRPRRTAGAVLALAACLVALPAQAQVSSFLDNLFGRKPAEESVQAAPAETPPVPAAPTARTPVPPRRAGARAAKNTDPTKTPDSVKASDPAKAEESGRKVAAVSSPPPAPAEPADPATLVAQANAYFNGVSTLTGNFLQIGADGRRIGGRLTLSRPGRLRFDYDQPSTLEVIADGTSVAVRDKKLATQDLYFISQTPLKFLLREKIDLARDMTVIGVESEPGGVRIAMEDRSTLGGTSRILLYFDPDMRTLKQWRITDPQGFQTSVVLSNLQRGRSVDGSLFFINYGRAEDKAAQQAIQQSR